jgi:DMSO/TMAO reductase YedYZ molybdopterin-dependent catalytic subunit
MASPPAIDDRNEPRRFGRGVFLATVAGGLTSLFWGKAAWDHVTGVISPVASTLAPILPTGGWRIYTISGHLPAFDAATWRLQIGGLVEQPTSLDYTTLRRLPHVD